MFKRKRKFTTFSIFNGKDLVAVITVQSPNRHVITVSDPYRAEIVKPNTNEVIMVPERK